MLAIYRITDTVDGRFYIGSSGSPKERWKEHCYALRRGKHHCKKLQQAYDMHGADALLFEIIDGVPTRHSYWLESIEGRYIAIGLAYSPGLLMNSARPGRAGSYADELQQAPRQAPLCTG